MPELDTTITPAERDQLRQMVTEMRNHFEEYHSRRENIAWGAVTIYLAGIAAFPTVFSSGNITLSLQTHIALAVVLLLTWFFVLHFVRDQFRGRHVAAAFVGACGEVIALLSDPQYNMTYSQIRHTAVVLEGNVYSCPQILRRIVEGGEDRDKQRLSKRPRWNELALLGVMAIWTNAAAFGIYCLPDSCKDDWQYLVLGGWALVIVNSVILGWTGYWQVIGDEWQAVHFRLVRAAPQTRRYERLVIMDENDPCADLQEAYEKAGRNMMLVDKGSPGPRRLTLEQLEKLGPVKVPEPRGESPLPNWEEAQEAYEKAFAALKECEEQHPKTSAQE